MHTVISKTRHLWEDQPECFLEHSPQTKSLDEGTEDHSGRESLSSEPIFRQPVTPPLTVGTFTATRLSPTTGTGYESHNERNASLNAFGVAERPADGLRAAPLRRHITNRISNRKKTLADPELASNDNVIIHNVHFQRRKRSIGRDCNLDG